MNVYLPCRFTTKMEPLFMKGAQLVATVSNVKLQIYQRELIVSGYLPKHLME